MEGNLDFWEKYIAASHVLDRLAPADSTTTATVDADADAAGVAGTRGVLTLRDGCQFVYGGDVCDRGKGDIRILSDLVALKERFPDRVHLILGNRYWAFLLYFLPSLLPVVVMRFYISCSVTLLPPCQR